MKKSMQKTMRFLTSLFLDFFSILEGFGAPKWLPKSLKISFSGVVDHPPSDFGPSKNLLNFLTTFWRPPGSIFNDFETILGDFLRIWELIFGDFKQL